VVPLYRQIERKLAAQIRRGALPAGSLVPSERQICEQFAVSHITARRALLELQNRGLIYRQAGIGTFVADPKRRTRLTLVLAGFDAAGWQGAAGAMGELVGGITEVAWRHNCALDIVRADEGLDAQRIYGLVEEQGSDGLLLRLAGDVTATQAALLDDTGIPYVLIRRYLEDRPVNCVVPADAAGMRLAVSHLARLGHRRVGLITALPEMVLTKERLRSYRAAVASLDLEADERLVCIASHYAGSASFECAVRLLSDSERPTAVIVDADMASGVYEAAAALRLAIPDELAVVGYDEVPEARSLVPGLTCVRTSHYETGKVAAEALLEIRQGAARPPQKLVIEPVLEVRASCGAGQPVAARLAQYAMREPV
jgi:LacI family transcriptional regulator